MSNGVFNFNFLALLLTEILGGSQIYTRGPYAPWTPSSGEIFLPKASKYFRISNCVSNFNILALVVSEILGGSQIYVRGLCPFVCPLAEKNFVPVASTLLCLMAFQFQLSSSCIFRHIWWSQIYTIGPYAPWTPPNGEFFFTRTEYFTISNCVFNFNILAVVVSDILVGSQIYVSGPCAPLYAP